MKTLKIVCSLTLVLMGSQGWAQDFVYKPVNPAFGGDTFNYNWLLSSANAQNQYEDEGGLGG